MYALRSVGVHVVPVALWRRLVVRGVYLFVRLVLGRGVGGGGGGRPLVDTWPFPRVARRCLQDRERRRRGLTRFTIRTLSPAISVNSLFGTLYRSCVLVILFFVSLGDLVLFRCAGSFWLAREFVRYLTGKTF